MKPREIVVLVGCLLILVLDFFNLPFILVLLVAMTTLVAFIMSRYHESIK